MDFPKTKGATYVNLLNILDQLRFQKFINQNRCEDWVVEICSYMAPINKQEN